MGRFRALGSGQRPLVVAGRAGVRLRAVVVLAILGLTLLLSRTLPAQQAVPVSTTYHVIESCPAKPLFLARLRMHTQRVRFSAERDALELDVRVRRVGSDFAGRLEVTRGGIALGSREFRDADCREVVWALALSAALSIDPEATLAVSDEADTLQPEPSDSAQAASPPDVSEASAGEAGSESTPRQRAESDASESSPGTADQQGPLAGRSHPLRWFAGPLALANFTLEPKAALGAGAMLSVSDLSRNVFPLELALRVHYLTTRMTRGADPLLLDWWAAVFQYCPLRAGHDVALLLCSQLEGGAISAEGVELADTRRKTRTMFAAGLGLQGRFALAERLAIVSHLDLQVPLSQRAFATSPGPVVVAASRPVGASLGLGALFGF